ncbi:MAG: cupin domain-containing protein [Candidatus Cloacimonetes bacterium]|nr:cupin domain-containing protein [Candidatus Cloacimonadota bacterium]
MPNIFTDLPKFPLPEEISSALFENDKVKIEKIISTGQASPPGFWYDQPLQEWVLLLSGSAVIKFNNPVKRIELQKGDFLLIPAHQLHRIESTSKNENTLWLAFFFP